MEKILKLQEKINSDFLKGKTKTGIKSFILERRKFNWIIKNTNKKSRFYNLYSIQRKIDYVEGNLKLNKFLIGYYKTSNPRQLIDIVNYRNKLSRKLGYSGYLDLYMSKLKLEGIDEGIFKKIDNLIINKILSLSKYVHKYNNTLSLSENDFNLIIKSIDSIVYRDVYSTCDIKYLNTNDGSITIYMPETNKNIIRVSYLTDVDKIEYLVHELGHAYETLSIGIVDRQKYKIFINSELQECIPGIVEGDFLKNLLRKDKVLFLKMYDHFKDIVTFIPYLYLKFKFEQFLYTSDNLNEKIINNQWNELVKLYMPHQLGNENFNWINKFNNVDDPFVELKYLFGKICALLSLLSVEKCCENIKKFWNVGFDFSSFLEQNLSALEALNKLT